MTNPDAIYASSVAPDPSLVDDDDLRWSEASLEDLATLELGDRVIWVGSHHHEHAAFVADIADPIIGRVLLTVLTKHGRQPGTASAWSLFDPRGTIPGTWHF